MSFRQRFLATVGTVVLLGASVLTAAADTAEVSIQVMPPTVNGTFNAYLIGGQFFTIESSATADQYSDGFIYMNVEDRRGTDAAWEVQFTMGDFIGQDTGEILPASGVVNQAVQIYDTSSWYGPFSSPDYYDPALQSFDVSTGVWSATGNQAGVYQSAWTGMLTVPANTAPDFYTSTLTLDVVSAP